MEDVDFTDDEISRELADLGYANIPTDRFHQFKKGFLTFIFGSISALICFEFT